jgi:periplasmic divalent cation tolerance protein
MTGPTLDRPIPDRRILVCLCSCPDRGSADAIAETLVSERLAACVNLLPGMSSVYRWEGRIERGEEVQLLIKTTPARLEALQARLCTLHPYDVPELIALEAVGGLSAYLHWVAAETTADPTAADARPAPPRAPD